MKRLIPLTRTLLLAFIVIAGQGIAWSQCLVYSFTQKYSESGYKSHSGVNTGYYIIGPKQVMQDSLTRYPYITFYLNSYKTGNTFDYFEDPPINYSNGNPSSGGLLIGLVRHGEALKILATKKNGWDPFDSDTLSGTALIKKGYGYIATTLSATYTSWFPNYNYYTNSQIAIGNSTNTPVNVYQYTGTDDLTPKLGHIKTEVRMVFVG
jgi:hypothetical protein